MKAPIALQSYPRHVKLSDGDELGRPRTVGPAIYIRADALAVRTVAQEAHRRNLSGMIAPVSRIALASELTGQD